MEIRKSRMEDIEKIMCVIHEAQESMRTNGIPQWQDGYPNEEVISQDIKIGCCLLYDGVCGKDCEGTSTTGYSY